MPKGNSGGVDSETRSEDMAGILRNGEGRQEAV